MCPSQQAAFVVVLSGHPARTRVTGWLTARRLVMHPTIAEQLAAMHRRESQEAAMMPYEAYRLYEIERPKTAAELRWADDRTGQLAAAAAGTLRRLAAPLRRPAAKPRVPRPAEQACPDDRMTMDDERSTKTVGV
jgi:hypothetical protein